MRKLKAKEAIRTLPPFVPHKEARETPGLFATNMQWLQNNWEKYDDKWVALHNGELVVSGDVYKDIEPFIENHPNIIDIMSFHIGHDIDFNIK